MMDGANVISCELMRSSLFLIMCGGVSTQVRRQYASQGLVVFHQIHLLMMASFVLCWTKGIIRISYRSCLCAFRTATGNTDP